MKNFLIVFVIFFAVQSCEENHPMATKLCDCYTQLHRANAESEINFWTDSCSSLYVGILNNLEKNLSEKNRFIKAYRRCQ
jgi:hypothetical protein